MKRHILYILLVATAHTVSGQSVTYNHDSSKMNQMTIAEIGSGSLTPDLYYTVLHKNYRKTAAAKNKLGFPHGRPESRHFSRSMTPQNSILP